MNGRLESNHNHRQQQQPDHMRQNADAESGHQIEPGRSPNAKHNLFGDILHGPSVSSFKGALHKKGGQTPDPWWFGSWFANR